MKAHETSITPKGELIFAKLNRPEENDSGVLKYSTGLLLNKKDAEAFHEAWVEVVEEEHGTGKGVTIPELKEYHDKEGNATGKYIFNFSQNAEINGDKKTVPFFDAKGAPVVGQAPNVGSGTIAKLSFSPIPYAVGKTKKGVMLALRAVQILELKEFGSYNPGFEAEEGSYEAAATPPARSEFEQTADYPDHHPQKPAKAAGKAKPDQDLDDVIPF